MQGFIPDILHEGGEAPQRHLFLRRILVAQRVMSLRCCDSKPGPLPLADARRRLLDQTSSVPGEEVLASAATLDQSAMDGYGLHADDLADGAAPA